MDNDLIDENDYRHYTKKEDFKTLKAGDTLIFRMHEGIFGIPYFK
ncbi:hypothetical protein [Halpernia frigidisoli]|uniref:Uncharacterized protein n=1 Tax=Halpernia frigidisoli TaxID=1125876 RepID=A0A1I3E408_9FLAO|nr:hypothetical protein [Halpernia frigidisoli]SFH93762.1 hypothetical protein SAMN05443292_0870 [Halpernia frigidisoli]